MNRLVSFSRWSIAFLALTAAQADYTVLHHFTGTAADGGNPTGELVLDGATLYGMTSLGGANNRGILFQVRTDGSGFTNLHSFAGGSADGSTPRGGLILAGGTLYGMTSAGGTNDFGVVFSMSTNGASFKVLRSFNGGISDGRLPSGSLLRIGVNLFGMTDLGGNSSFGYGTIFRVQTNGSNHTILYKFTGASGDGGWPGEGLTLAGDTVYGGTEVGGSTGNGTVFQMKTNGASFQLLHSFTESAGRSCKGILTRAGTTLYGTTVIGGSSSAGTVFRVETNGANFAVLHHLAGPPDDGLRPHRQLQLVGPTLLGTTLGGGNSASGTVFQVNTNGTGALVLHHFTGGPNDGCNPIGALTVADSTCYGMTWAGGSNNLGVIYALTPVPPNPPGFDLWQLAFFGCTNCPEAQAQADPLGKGMNNLSQYRAGLNPTNPASLFRILAVNPVNADVNVTWQTAGGHTNLLEISGDLAGGFTDLSSNILTTGVGDTTTNYFDIGAATNGLPRFYRVRLVP